MLLVAADSPDLGRQPRHDLEQVAHDAVVRDLEDRRVLVPIDGDDGLGRAHAGEVLNGPGDADRDVETRAHRLPGLADLRTVIAPTRVNHRAARADGGVAERRGELLEQLEISRLPE